MSNYIVDNKATLEQRHYLRLANAETYWCEFVRDRIEYYLGKYGRNFCIVIYRSEGENDAYVIPYHEIETLFVKELLYARGRWIGSIRNNVIKLKRGDGAISVSPYYNNFDLLNNEDGKVPTLVGGTNILYGVKGVINRSNLEKKIEQFNEMYRNVSPYRRRMVSEEIARPGAITDYIKRLCDYTCQICNEQGFMQRNGIPYIEAHHIQELHKLLPGSYCSDNIIIVCATCHRKLHYANVSYDFHDDGLAVVRIGGVNYFFVRNILT